MKNIVILLSLLGLLLLGACRDDFMVGDPMENPIPNPTEVPIFYETEVKGRVVDAAGIGIANATVTIDAQTLTTDPFGFYDSGKILAPSTGLYVKATKEGYFVGGSQFNPNELITETLIIVTLSEYDSPSTFASSDGVTMSLANGATLEIPKDAFSLNGQNYEGQVIVNMKWLDPTAANTQTLMPGSLLGLTESGERELLKTFGMIAVEMTDPSGAPLQILEGQEAELTFPVPAEILASAPDEIPLWHFNEIEGIWVEEGSATKTGNSYKGMVSHFTWWNCDVPGPYTYLCLNFFDDNNNALSNVDYCLLSPTLGIASGRLESSNVVCALVPSDEELILEMKDNCGQVYDSVTIGPYAEGDANDIVAVDAVPTTNLITVFGTVENCGGTVVEYGFVSIETDFGTLYDLNVEDGTYSISFTACDVSETEVTMTATDLDNLEQSIPQTFDLDYSQSTFENNLVACGQAIEAELVFTSTTLGVNLTSTECKARVTPDEILISASDGPLGPNGEYRVLIGIQEFSVGTHPANLIVFLEASNGFLQLDAPNDDFEVEILEYGNVGQTINGRFNYQGTEVGSFIADRIQ